MKQRLNQAYEVQCKRRFKTLSLKHLISNSTNLRENSEVVDSGLNLFHPVLRSKAKDQKMPLRLRDSAIKNWAAFAGFAQLLAQKTRATLSTNQKQN